MAKKKGSVVPIEVLPALADILAANQKAELTYREKPISSGPVPPPVPTPQATPDEEVDNEPLELIDEAEQDPTATPEQREQRRLSRKPRIDHLPDGVALLDDGTVLPLFDVGSRIVAERHTALLPGMPWLDTRVYRVRSIDDETGTVSCDDEELRHHAAIGFKHPLTRIKLAPDRGNPFRAPRRPNAGAGQRSPDRQAEPAGDKKRRGRPKGSKNRDKATIDAEKQQRKAERQQKKGRRGRR